MRGLSVTDQAYWRVPVIPALGGKLRQDIQLAQGQGWLHDETTSETKLNEKYDSLQHFKKSE